MNMVNKVIHRKRVATRRKRAMDNSDLILSPNTSKWSEALTNLIFTKEDFGLSKVVLKSLDVDKHRSALNVMTLKFKEDYPQEKWYIQNILPVALKVQAYFSHQRSIIIDAKKVKSLTYILLRHAIALLNLPEATQIKKVYTEFFSMFGIKEFSETVFSQLLLCLLTTLGDYLCEDLEVLDSKPLDSLFRNITLIKESVRDLMQTFTIFIKNDSEALSAHESTATKNFITILQKNYHDESFLLHFGKFNLLLLDRLGIIEQKVTKITSNNTKRKVVHIQLSKYGKELLFQMKKEIFFFSRSIPMLHYPYPISLSEDKNAKSIIGTGLIDTAHFLDLRTAVEPRHNGCRVEAIAPSVVRVLNILATTPYSLNFPLVEAYKKVLFDKNTTFLSKSTSEKYALESPFEKQSDSIRLSYLIDRLDLLAKLSFSMLRVVFESKIVDPLIKERFNLLINALAGKNEELRLKAEEGLSRLLADYMLYFSAKKGDTRLRIYDLCLLAFSGASWERSLIQAPFYFSLQGCFADFAIAYVTYFGSHPDLSESLSIKTLTNREKLILFCENYQFFKSPKIFKRAKKKYSLIALWLKIDDLGLWKEDTIDNFKEHFEKAISNIIVAYDNTGSGLQILSLILGSQELPLNLAPNVFLNRDDIKVEDFYEDMSNLIKKTLLSISTDQEITNSTNRLLVKVPYILYKIVADYVINRSVVKKPVMASIYGLTYSGIRQHIKESLDNFVKETQYSKNKDKLQEDCKELFLYYEALDYIKKYNILFKRFKLLRKRKETRRNRRRVEIYEPRKNLSLNEQESLFLSSKLGRSFELPLLEKSHEYSKVLKSFISDLSRIIQTQVIVNLKSVYKLYSLLQEYALACASLNVPIKWSTITGDALIVQEYFIEKSQVYRTPKIFPNFRSKQITLRKYIKMTLDAKKNSNSFPPNFVQSLDAAILRYIVLGMDNISKHYKERILISTLHDNYLVPISYSRLFKDFYKHSLVEIFSEANINNMFASLKNPTEIIREAQERKGGRVNKTVAYYEKHINNMQQAYNELKHILLGEEAVKARSNLLEKLKRAEHILTVS